MSTRVAPAGGRGAAGAGAGGARRAVPGPPPPARARRTRAGPPPPAPAPWPPARRCGARAAAAAGPGGLPPLAAGLAAELRADPALAPLLDDPRVAAAVAELARDPGALQRYAGDRRVRARAHARAFCCRRAARWQLAALLTHTLARTRARARPGDGGAGAPARARHASGAGGGVLRNGARAAAGGGWRVHAVLRPRPPRAHCRPCAPPCPHAPPPPLAPSPRRRARRRAACCSPSRPTPSWRRCWPAPRRAQRPRRPTTRAAAGGGLRSAHCSPRRFQPHPTPPAPPPPMPTPATADAPQVKAALADIKADPGNALGRWAGDAHVARALDLLEGVLGPPGGSGGGGGGGSDVVDVTPDAR